VGSAVWDYNAGGQQNSLPMPFRDSAGDNPLYVAQRNPGINAGAGLPASITSPAFALSRPLFTGASEFGGGVTSPFGQFWSQTGRLEQTPHNDVHVAIGGWTGDPDTAAQDPIFWLHHANIDRLWWLWQQTHATLTDPAWRRQSFDFVDAAGTRVSLTDADLDNIETQLDYTYDQPVAQLPSAVRDEAVAVNWPKPWPERPQPAQAAAVGPEAPEPVRHILGTTDAPVRLTGEQVAVAVPIDARATEALHSQNFVAANLQHRAFLDLDDIEAERNPGVVYGVYVNLPDHRRPGSGRTSRRQRVSLRCGTGPPPARRRTRPWVAPVDRHHRVARPTGCRRAVAGWHATARQLPAIGVAGPGGCRARAREAGQLERAPGPAGHHRPRQRPLRLAGPPAMSSLTVAARYPSPRLLLLRHPEAATGAAVALAWLVLLGRAAGAALADHHSRHAASMSGMDMTGTPPTTQDLLSAVLGGLPGWALMSIAMMGPAALAGVQHTARNSLCWRRRRAIAEFAAGYLIVWMIYGAAALTTATVIPGLPGAIALAGALAVAATWQLSPLKRRWLRDCHRSVPLPARGWRAEAGAVRFGLLNGTACLGSCWPFMLVMVAAPSHQLIWTAALTLATTTERLQQRPRRTTRLLAAALAAAAAAAGAVTATIG
jgi:predicted metal-binding membrane protein